jgi:two-component system, chemotaxis family, CheB/CheR fusion protein
MTVMETSLHLTPVVAIGGSVGALPAFTKLLGAVPDDTGMSFVVLQHLDPRRDSVLAHLLSAPSRMPVREVRDEMQLQPNEVFVVPSAHDVAYRAGVFRLGPRRVPSVPSDLIDGFMQSIAAAQGSHAMGIILSGNGRDGVQGLAAIRNAGGVTFCQTPASARSAAMPRAAIAAGVVDFILDPEQIALELVRISKTMVRIAPQTPSELPALDPGDLGRLFAVLRAATGLDFRDYKPATMRRRIERRMRLTKRLELPDYVAHVRGNAGELAVLHADLLIGVTRFFRDARAFSALRRTVLPPLVKASVEGAALRIWIAGCATGQEAYSIAMCVSECLDGKTPAKPIQVFATDALEASVAWARAGVYPATIRQEMSQERLQRFFVRHGDGYQVARPLRDLCVFARQDLIADPAFSRLNLISCRNVLIYLEPGTQKKVLAKFHHALLPGGTLFLGASESVSSRSQLFERTGPEEPSYRPRAPMAQAGARPEIQVFTASPRAASKACIVPTMDYDARKEADRVLLGRFVAAAILVDPQLQVLQFRGQTGPFMGPLSGSASLHVLKLVDEALLPALRYGLASVQRTLRAYCRKGVVAQLQGVPRELDLEIIPLRTPQADQTSCLIVFSDVPRVRDGERARAGSVKGAAGKLIAQLREELALTREHLQASVLEQESSNESLRAALEELQSTNEELQVTNEELETGKEELQSTNEDLTIAHDEVQMRNAELRQLVHDQINLVEATGIAAILFGPDLRLRRLTPSAAALVRLTLQDVGRPLAELQLGLEAYDLPKLFAEVMAQQISRELQVQTGPAQHFLLCVRPYRAVDGNADGVVLTLAEMTALRTSEEALHGARQRILELEMAAFNTGAPSN